MPGDSRRINGPEKTYSPGSFTTSTKSKPLLTETDERPDGRKLDIIRPIFLKTGVVSQAQGSAYIEQNETKVICAVYGPREVLKKEEFSMKGQLSCEFKFATFSCQHRRSHQQDGEEKDFSVQLLEALEPAVCLHKFPKAQVNIYVTVLQNDGSGPVGPLVVRKCFLDDPNYYKRKAYASKLVPDQTAPWSSLIWDNLFAFFTLAASITCASVALADAGVEMYDLVAGCSVRLYNDRVLMDPCLLEEYSSEKDSGLNNGSVTVGLMPSLHQISAVTSKGEIQFELLKKAMGSCVEMCEQLYPVLQQSLISAMKAKSKDTT